LGSRDHRLLYTSAIGYLLSFIIPSIIIICSSLGQQYDYANFIAFIPIILMYLAPPIINKFPLFKSGMAFNPPEKPAVLQLYYRLLPIVSVLLQFFLLWSALDFWTAERLNFIGFIGWGLSVGTYSALFAINVGHELIHRSSKFERMLGGVILSSVCFGSFKIVHLRIHHRYVGTSRDFASSKRNQSLYNYWRQAVVGNFTQAVKCELNLINKPSKNIWHSELFWWTLLSLSIGVVISIYWGIFGLFFFLIQSWVAILKLEMINYLQHYGLRRAVDNQGKFEPVGPHHAWSQSSLFTNFVLINLLRHSDHHVYPKHAYETLKDNDGSPEYPYDFSIMCILTLIPSLFFRIADKQLDRFTNMTLSSEKPL